LEREITGSGHSLLLHAQPAVGVIDVGNPETGVLDMVGGRNRSARYALPVSVRAPVAAMELSAAIVAKIGGSIPPQKETVQTCDFQDWIE
jgi:hypothetical protein